MKLAAIVLALALATLALGACGGPPPRVDDEVGAEWTAGDDAPLEERTDAGSED